MIIREALGTEANTRLELLDNEGAGHVALLPSYPAAVLGGEDGQVIVGSDKGKIGITIGEREDDGLRILGDHRVDSGKYRARGRFRLFAAVILVSCDDV